MSAPDLNRSELLFPRALAVLTEPRESGTMALDSIWLYGQGGSSIRPPSRAVWLPAAEDNGLKRRHAVAAGAGYGQAPNLADD